MIRALGVFGAGGRMGTTVCNAVATRPTWSSSPRSTRSTRAIDLHQLGVYDTQIQIAAKRPPPGRRRGRRLHRARRGTREPAVVRGRRAAHGSRDHRIHRKEFRELAQLFDRSATTGRNHAQFLHRRGADDEVRRARPRRTSRASRSSSCTTPRRPTPPRAPRRALRSAWPTPAAQAGSARGTRRHRDRPRRRPRSTASTGSRCTPSACAACSPTRRCCSAARARP